MNKRGNRKRNKGKEKKAIVLPEVAWWILAIIALALVFIGIIILKSKGEFQLNKILDFFRFR